MKVSVEEMLDKELFVGKVIEDIKKVNNIESEIMIAESLTYRIFWR